MKKKKGSFATLFLVFLLLSGLAFLLYPSVSNYWNSLHQSRAIAGYAREVASLDQEKYDEIWDKAKNYNASIVRQKEVYILSDEQRDAYERQLDPSGSGVMGYIEIPCINCSLPIYHGTDESVLQIAAGHLEWSSLPVGGESTHCVLSGHRGLPSATLFTHLDKLKEGDIFLLRILNEVLTYEVDQILTVEPEDISALQIVEGKDYCTLMTCTPYGVNTHRLLVRGHRIKNENTAETVPSKTDAVQIRTLSGGTLAVVLICLLLLLLAVCLLLRRMKNRQGGDTDENE